MEFRGGKMCEVGAKFVDRGFDGLKVFGRRGRGIVGHVRGFRVRLKIYRGLGVRDLVDGFTRRFGILTAISCCPRPRRTERRNDYLAANARGSARGPWFSERKQSTSSVYARGHRQVSGVHYSLKEFYRAEVWGVVGVLRWVLVGRFCPHGTLLGYASDCAATGQLLHSCPKYQLNLL
jgi:hypothetical protein